MSAERFQVAWINPLVQLGFVDMTCVVTDSLGELPTIRAMRSWRMLASEVTDEFLAGAAQEIIDGALAEQAEQAARLEAEAAAANETTGEA
jgi:hypothetical protein